MAPVNPEVLQQDERGMFSLSLLQLSYGFDQLFKQIDLSMNGKDKDMILRKHMTPVLYWWIVDVIYFSEETDAEFEAIKEFRQKNGSIKLSHNELLQPTCFILELHKMVSNWKNSLNLDEIRDTSIEDIILLFKNYQYLHTLNLDKKLQSLHNSILLSRQADLQSMHLLGIALPSVKCSCLFHYSKFDQQFVQYLITKYEQYLASPKCQVCNKTRNVLSCKKCDFRVHALCYPKLIPKESQFLCEVCRNNLEPQTTCMLCPCLGGQFLQSQQREEDIVYILKTSKHPLRVELRKDPRKGDHNLERSGRSTFKRSYIHLSCFLWQSDFLDYDQGSSLVIGLHRIDQTKPRSPCYLCGTMIGQTVSCAQNTCKRFYHPECAKRARLYMSYIRAKNKILPDLYCERHQLKEISTVIRERNVQKLKELKKFYETMDFQIKKMSNQPYIQQHFMPKKLRNPIEAQSDTCQACNKPNDFQSPISNCRSCFGWVHLTCSSHCLLCKL